MLEESSSAFHGPILLRRDAIGFVERCAEVKDTCHVPQAACRAARSNHLKLKYYGVMVLLRRFTHGYIPTLPQMADEVEALKRELEALKLQLEKERKTSAAVQGDTDSPKQLAGPPRDESPKPKRRGGDAKTSAAPKEPRIYVQHAAVGTRRGKWWLRDRQVLSRAMLEEGGGTLKLRESWVWSGRSVVLDKIVRIQEVEGGQEDATLEEEIVMEEEAAVTGEVVENPAARSASPRTAATVPREAQESEAAETSRSPTTTGEKAVANAVVEEEALTPQKSGKADDEVRESSAPVQPGPPVASANI